MSAIHQCKDGGTDITGRGTPNKIPCENQGGEINIDIQQFPGGGSQEEEIVDTEEIGSTPMGLNTAGFMGLPTMAWIAIGGVALYYAYSKGMFKKLIK